MKLAWFTPFGTKSAIGNVSKVICEELQRQGHAVDIFSAEQEDRIDTPVNVKVYTSETIDISELAQYDDVFYNMGNNGTWHSQIWETMKRFPGKVVLHDRFMSGFFRQYFKESGEQKGYELFRSAMLEYYGEGAEAAADQLFHYTEENEKILALMIKYTMLPVLLKYATGIFTHSVSFASQVQDDFFGPISWAYLPYQIPKQPEVINLKEILPALNHEDRLLIVTNGIVHRVKRIDVIAEVLCENPEIADKVCLVSVGSYGGQYGERLKALSDGKLHHCFYLLGYQPDHIMKGLLQEADIAINLRYPNSEVCSLSLWEQMARKNPVITLKSGIFGELPAECIVQINKEKEKQELKEALSQMIEHKEKREEVGDNAEDFIRTQCTAEEYAEKIVRLAKQKKNGESCFAPDENCLRDANRMLREMGFSSVKHHASIYHIFRHYSRLLQAVPPDKKQVKHKTIGIWFGFWYHVPHLSREGISRFMGCMVKGLLEAFDYDIEVWTYSFNEEEVRKIFSSCTENETFCRRVQFITEKSWTNLPGVPEEETKIEYSINAEQDNLAQVARKYSNAEVFLPAIIYLDNVVPVGRRLVVPAHDMAVKYHYNDFLTTSTDYKFQTSDILARAENFALAGAKMFTASEFVKKEHILKNIRNIREEDITVVPFPVFVSKASPKLSMNEEKLKEKFGLQGRYLFYPSQIRPHKNIELLLKALAKLRSKNPDVVLALTGDISVVPSVRETAEELELLDAVKVLPNVTEDELFALYHYASAIPVPTCMEANFPTQATEALYSKRPLVLSRIPVVVERIADLCGTEEQSGLLLFDPHDEEECAKQLEKALELEEQVIKNQAAFADKLLSYSWKDAAKKYNDIMFESE